MCCLSTLFAGCLTTLITVWAVTGAFVETMVRWLDCRCLLGLAFGLEDLVYPLW